MKKNMSLPTLEEKVTENGCKCCQALGISDIVQWLADEDAKKDVRKRLNKSKKQDDGIRKRQLNVFVDKDHEVMLEFYTLLERDLSDDKMIKGMRKLIAKDPDFLDPYLTISDILFSMGKNEEAEAILKEAYERALLTITDLKGRWPKEMSWGFLENRHILRAIEEYGLLLWEDGKVDEALNIFRKLLKINPGDNQGARYNILAIRMGLNFDEWEKPFEAMEDGQIIGLNALQVHEWFESNAPKFEDDFQWLLNLYRSWDAA